MAAPTASTPRWERAGEPSNAFSGLSRGRGSRGRGGLRGGRRGSRANPTAREQSTEDNSLTSKDDLPQASQPTTQPTQPSADKPPILSTTRSKVKPPRKPSRGDPPPLQAPRTPITPDPNATRSSNRRRRSQVSKSNANDPKISPTAYTDSQNVVVPASTLSKDPPPHLKHRVDVRHNIDALVERVRAVAMDNRPTTPGSHIDWAGDDDDTLPDLNDWGVTTSEFAAGESETISPIILEGLKPLPDVPAPAIASPLRQVATADNPATSHTQVKINTLSFVCGESSLTPCRPDEDQITVLITPVASKNLDTVSQVKAESPELPLPPKHVGAPYPSNRKPWHPSLPPKPPAGSLVPRVSLRPVATPMRHPAYPKSTHNERSLAKEAQSTTEQVAVESTSAASPVSMEVVSAIVKLADERVLETSNTEEDKGRAESTASNSRPERTDPTPQKDISDDDSKVEGLEVSIHAPTAPASIAPHPPPRNHWPFKEANNRHPPLSRNPNGDQFNHVYRQWNERSGFQTGFSPRNRLSPNGAGSPNSHHRIPASRPIITGDAMSRLARTIGHNSAA